MTRIDDFWQDLGELPSAAVAPAREELLAAVRIVAAVAGPLIGGEGEGSRRLTYLSEAGAVVTPAIGEAPGLRLGLSLCAFDLVALDGDGVFLDALPLADRTGEEVAAWLAGHAASAVGREVAPPRVAELELPAAMLAGGGTFSADLALAVRELGRYFADTELLLEAIAADTKGAGPVFVTTEGLELVVEVTVTEGEERAFVSAGLSPGDESHDEPFWRVVPSPPPEVDQPPVIAEPGHWHRDGWQGTAMTATELFERRGEQPRAVDGFLRRSLTLCRGLLS